MSFQIIDTEYVFCDGGMSTEIAFTKYYAFRMNKVYSGWNVGIKMVYPAIIRDTLFSVVEHVKALESERCQKTVLISPGFLSVPYMVELCNLIYLPSQFLVGFNKFEDLETLLLDLKENGIKSYAVAGYDGCIPSVLVAWIKFIEVPPIYKDLISNYLLTSNVIIGGVYADNGMTTGENFIYQYKEQTSTIHEGNIYLLHINACYDKSIQQDWSIFKTHTSDFHNEEVVQTRVEYVGDWESSFDLLDRKFMKDYVGTTHLFSATHTKPLYAISYELSRKFMSINKIVIKGVVLNPYIMNNPLYEANYGYLGYSYWACNPHAREEILKTIFNDLPRDGLVWFNDQADIAKSLFDEIISNKIRINNTSTLCNELGSWIKQHRPRNYPMRDILSITQLREVLDKVKITVGSLQPGASGQTRATDTERDTRHQTAMDIEGE